MAAKCSSNQKFWGFRGKCLNMESWVSPGAGGPGSRAKWCHVPKTGLLPRIRLARPCLLSPLASMCGFRLLASHITLAAFADFSLVLPFLVAVGQHPKERVGLFQSSCLPLNRPKTCLKQPNVFNQLEVRTPERADWFKCKLYVMLCCLTVVAVDVANAFQKKRQLIKIPIRGL